MSIERNIPFQNLRRSENNVRRTGRDSEKYLAGIEALAASILSQGLLQNLVVQRLEDKESFAVVAGGRRFDAIQLLASRGDIDADWPVRAIEVLEDEATAASLSENVQREGMHPADEFDAFNSLALQGWSIDKIADAFGVSPLVVERRLKLAAASPVLIEKYRKDEISTDQMIALCSTDDHSMQEAVWEQLGTMNYSPSAAQLRRVLLAQEVDASQDERVTFIGGLSAYQAAGGDVRRDLFSTNGEGGFLSNVALLEKMVADRLQEQADALRAEGWGWVEVWPSFDYTAFQRLGRAPMSAGELSCEEKAALEALTLQLQEAEEGIAALHDKDEELTDDESERLDSLYDAQVKLAEEIEEINDRNLCIAPEVKAVAGVVVCRQGKDIRIERALVKPTDRKAVAAALPADESISGGRETEPAGRKTDALSDAMRRSLLGHRNIAAQSAVAAKPHVAKVLMACWLVHKLRDGYSNVPSDFTITGSFGTRTNHPIADQEGVKKRDAFDAMGDALIQSLPKADDKLWDALMELEADALDKLICFAVARSVSLNVEHKGLTAKLLQSLEFDMADHFTPTAENYFGRVPKGLVVEAMTEAGIAKGEKEKAELLGMKKGDLAALAEKRMAETRWVPSLIRTPKPKKATAPKAPTTAANTTKKQAKKAAKPKATPRTANADTAQALTA